ncbi:MAG: hypothetical protein HKP41_10350 [Desulfobacterales bacterium]|nr:hypothetical protein [Deltaproteobacteria bacterium]NND16230.1 hypothetical protein [Eudoraea sp.]NNK94738.1 hypothetical protein [Desulfobacterales bacterium]
MINFDAFFIQCSIAQSSPDYPSDAKATGLATIIVFANNIDIARAYAGRIIADNNLAIVRLKHIQRINIENIPMLNSTLLSLYKKAELYGIGFHCDFWSTTPRCCCGNTSIQSNKYNNL